MANSKQLSTMLKQLGWGSGFKLPISNEENTKLEQLLERKQSRLVSLSLELQEVSSAVDNSTSFMKNLTSKIKHAKDVEAAKRSQMEKERHFLGLAKRDHAKTEEDIRRMEKRLNAKKERNKQLEDNVIRRKDALGELVDVINFDKRAITAYEDKFSKEDVYMKLIEDFADTDNEKLKKCRDEYQQLGEKVTTSKAVLNQTLSETDILEGELEELAKRFRRVHAERNQSIDNWKRTLEVLEDRDQEIMEISADYQAASLEVKKKSCMLEKQERFYENAQVQTKSYECELHQIERIMSMLHRRKRDFEAQVNENSDSVSELVGYIVSADKEIKSTRGQLNAMDGENDGWKSKLQAVNKELESLKAKYDAVTMESLTSTEHTKQLQDFLEKEEKKAEALIKELTKQNLWKSQREKQMKDIEQEIVLAEAEAKNVKAAIARTRKQCVETGDYLFKTNTVAYQMDLKAMNLMMKVHGLENPETMYSKEDYVEAHRQIEHFKKVYNEQLETQTQIKAQISHCEHVNFTCQRELMKEKDRNEEYEITLYSLETEIKRIGKEDELFLENMKDMGVNNSLLHVQLRRMLQSIKTYESKMFDLGQQRITMQMAVKERKKDIEIYTALLLNKKRSVEDESQKLRVKCHEVTNDVQARKRKYEMVMGQMWAATDDYEQTDKDNSNVGEGRSEAYYIIKLAQEREHYRQEGDKWDERVKEAEKIVEGLQNTLALMMGTNEAFKDSLKPATENTSEGRQLQELKQKELDVVRNLKAVKDEREKYSQKLKEKQYEIEKFIAHKAEYEHQLMEKQYELQGVIAEINGQKEKIQRATQQANKLVRELSKLEALDAELLQNDLRLRVTKEKFEFAVLTLEKLLQINPDLITETLDFLHAKGMEGLAGRITRKMISPSLASTPHQSGRSTPFSSRTNAGTRKPMKSSLRRSSGADSRSTMGGSMSNQIVDRRSTQKSVVFETLTSTPSTKKMLENISKGLEAHRKSKSANRLSAPSHKTTKSATLADAAGGISFVELRKALQDAVAEQKKRSRVGDDKMRIAESDVENQEADELRLRSVDVVESAVAVLVDNREKFEEAAHDDHV